MTGASSPFGWVLYFTERPRRVGGRDLSDALKRQCSGRFYLELEGPSPYIDLELEEDARKLHELNELRVETKRCGRVTVTLGWSGPPTRVDASRQPRPYSHVRPRVEQALLADPVGHDGSSRDLATEDPRTRLSGELRIEIEALTPLIVGNEQIPARQGLHGSWPRFGDKKKLLLPLRLPDGRVLLSGAGLLGMLRHAIGILADAPMERVEERSYSYRPNARTPLQQDLRLEPRPAIVTAIEDGLPSEVTLYPMSGRRTWRFNQGRDEELRHLYRGGIEAWQEDERGESQLAGRRLHGSAEPARRLAPDREGVPISRALRDDYARTLDHLADSRHGHLSPRHPEEHAARIAGRLPGKWWDDPGARPGERVGLFEVDDLIYVEWEPGEERVRSFGHHFYYRWAHNNTVRTRWNPQGEPRNRWELRPSVRPRPEELEPGPEGLPAKLSGARLLFGYAETLDGKGLASQLAGRLAGNFAVEVIDPDRQGHKDRFIAAHREYVINLLELGMPRPSAAEFYLDQEGGFDARAAEPELRTYGDLLDHDAGEHDDPEARLAGRKVYLHRPEAARPDEQGTWCFEDSNWRNERSSLARYVSKPGTTFRWTLRFRDLRPWELALVLLALAPDRYAHKLSLADPPAEDQDSRMPRYALKLGHGRPLGLGSVVLRIDSLHVLDAEDRLVQADASSDSCFNELKQVLRGRDLSSMVEWLATCRFDDSQWGPYPSQAGHIYRWHTGVRGLHLVDRRLYHNKSR